MNIKILGLMALMTLQIPFAYASKDYYDFRWELKQLQEKQRDPSQDDSANAREKMKIENEPMVLDSSISTQQPEQKKGP